MCGGFPIQKTIRHCTLYGMLLCVHVHACARVCICACVHASAALPVSDMIFHTLRCKVRFGYQQFRRELRIASCPESEGLGTESLSSSSREEEATGFLSEP